MLIIALVVTLGLAQGLLIERKPVWSIQVEAGSPFAVALPTIFHNYQYSSLLSLKKVDGSSSSTSTVCAITV